MIISASRRTDIPAFYAKWFLNRLKAGFVYVRNPMNYHQISSVKLSPENVDCIVFWTKDPQQLMKYLDEIDSMGYKYYFQFTITPYDKDVEKNVRDKKEIVQTFKNLSEIMGKEKVILRYDPIFITNQETGYTAGFHKDAFLKYVDELNAYTDRVVISFLDGYRKVAKNTLGLGIKEMNEEDMNEIANTFSEITKMYNLELETCAEKIDLAKYGISHTSCIDGNLIEKIIGYKIINKDNRDDNRENCGCMKCIDIGQYDSCIHNCLYCYANINKEQAVKNNKSHNPDSSILFGIAEPYSVKVRNERDTKSFKILNEQIELDIK